MAYVYEYPHPAVTTDAVLFTVRDGRLEVLLIQRRHEPYAGRWAFPGGFLDYEEDLLDCALRELEEETGVSGVELEQFHAAGTPGRDPRERNISILHMGLVRPDEVNPVAADDAGDVGWFDARRPPPLAFDHEDLMPLAVRHLTARIMHSDAALRFLPQRFTLSELQGVYEAVLDKDLDREDFRRVIQALDWLRPTGEYAREASGREQLFQSARRKTARRRTRRAASSPKHG
ncbi:MAG: NUDIX domain-containing protein [Gammaproteobacteria bacterium]